MATLALVALALAYTPSRPPLINTRSDLAAPPAELEPTNGHAVLPMPMEFNEPLRLPARRAKQPGKPSLMKRCVAEATGTAFIALGLSTVSSLQLGLVASSFWVAFVIAMAVWAAADVSGAHFNPAITLGLAITSDGFRLGDTLPYTFAQMAGASLASVALSGLLGIGQAPGMPGAFRSEVLLTAALAFGAFGVGEWVRRGIVRERSSPALIGSWVGALSYSFGHLRAGLNPAVSFGPRAAAAALGGGAAALGGAHAYLLGPCIGGVLGGMILATCRVGMDAAAALDSFTPRSLAR